MVRAIQTADNIWVWMLAMNESIGEYNARLSREIGSPELALSTIEGLIDTYDSASQAQMNTACNVYMFMSKGNYEKFKKSSFNNCNLRSAGAHHITGSCAVSMLT